MGLPARLHSETRTGTGADVIWTVTLARHSKLDEPVCLSAHKVLHRTVQSGFHARRSCNPTRHISSRPYRVLHLMDFDP
jgi:hypothetical protein